MVLRRTIAWLIVIAVATASIILTSEFSPLMRMIIIVSTQLLAMKVVVIIETYDKVKLSLIQWLVFTFGWVGMRPAPFKTLPSKSLPYSSLIVKAIVHILSGIIFLKLSVFINNVVISKLFLLIGISLILHFGLLNAITALYRGIGVNVSELFRSPYKAKSLKEFWGSRWNAAFSEMTAIVAYRPLKNVIGMDAAMIVSFLLSGLLHEIAISFPVRSGYGLPTLYFVIHAAAMLLESRSATIKKITEHRILSHVWVFLMLIVPMPLLFSHAFIAGVLVPLRDTLFQIIR